MKKKLLVAVLLAFGAVAYAETAAVKPETSEVATVEATMPQAQEQVVTFVKEKGGEEVIVTSLDNFETAKITVGKETHDLQKVEAGSGTKLESKDKKTSIHFAKGEGILVENGKEVMVKEKVSK